MKGRNNMFIVLFLLYCILASSGLVLFKLGSSNANNVITLFSININFSFKMLLGIICYGVSFLLWLYIISKVNLTYAMPLSVAVVNTFVIIESSTFLKERISLVQGIGIFIVILGVCLITVGRK